MKEITITQAQLTINTLRVGAKQVTKAMWGQIPFAESIRERGFSVLGFVLDNTSLRRTYLINKDGNPYRVSDYTLDIMRGCIRDISSNDYIYWLTNDSHTGWAKKNLTSDECDASYFLTVCRTNVRFDGGSSGECRISASRRIEEVLGVLEPYGVKRGHIYMGELLPNEIKDAILARRDECYAMFPKVLNELTESLKLFNEVPQLYIAV